MSTKNTIYSLILQNREKDKKQLAVLLDPDKQQIEAIPALVRTIAENGADFIFVGGSLMVKPDFEVKLLAIKLSSSIPVIIFPGNPLQINKNADGLLLLSLISGRNPELLIGQHVIAAPSIKSSGLEILSTGYILVDCGKATTASYISNSMPVPFDKPEIAACTALAGEQLGFKLIYLDGGSGAVMPISLEMINQTKESIALPLIVGGGIKTPEQALIACKAGADIIVVGTAFEDNLSSLKPIAEIIKNSK
ncbi:MAG: geranylgeranylglyceryl/heptaprenylglyceryl phosphate synthase [Bacteroidota bacterium]|nr:geranylgeranylglyceryl/heptaprenylglyceryl phosphate synthase [Bacteroidota bacterium]